jgi:hypothetical protein
MGEEMGPIDVGSAFPRGRPADHAIWQLHGWCDVNRAHLGGHRLRRVLGIGALAAALLLGSGCSDDDPKADSTTTEESSTTSTEPDSTTTADPVEVLKREIVEVHKQWRGELRRMYEKPDPSSPLLDRLFADGERKELIREDLARSQAAGTSSPPRPDDQSAWTVTAMQIESDTNVLATECYLDGGWILDSSGKVIDDRIYSHVDRIRFVKGGDGIWRALDIERISKDEGRVGCAEQLK